MQNCLLQDTIKDANDGYVVLLADSLTYLTNQGLKPTTVFLSSNP